MAWLREFIKTSTGKDYGDPKVAGRAARDAGDSLGQLYVLVLFSLAISFIGWLLLYWIGACEDAPPNPFKWVFG